MDKLKLRLTRRAWLGIGGLALLGLVGLGWWWAQRLLPPKPAASHSPVIISKDTPDEGAVNGDKLVVGATEPHRISLPTIGADGFLQKIGLDQHGGIATPDNIHTGGWYVHEVRPGDEGLAIINGYVKGKSEPGIFHNLASLKLGDQFSVVLGDQSVRRFEVIRVTSQSVAQTSDRLLVQEPGVAHQLNLITCGAGPDDKVGEPSERVLVVSKLVQ